MRVKRKYFDDSVFNQVLACVNTEINLQLNTGTHERFLLKLNLCVSYNKHGVGFVQFKFEAHFEIFILIFILTGVENNMSSYS